MTFGADLRPRLSGGTTVESFQRAILLLCHTAVVARRSLVAVRIYGCGQCYRRRRYDNVETVTVNSSSQRKAAPEIADVARLCVYKIRCSQWRRSVYAAVNLCIYDRNAAAATLATGGGQSVAEVDPRSGRGEDTTADLVNGDIE